MGLVKIELNKVDIDRLARALQSVNEVRFNAVVKKNVTELLNAARNGGTPIDTGELRKSSGIY
ncbi:MAG: HK97 gp10 family phage protein, partial [Schaedlerella sp.]